MSDRTSWRRAVGRLRRRGDRSQDVAHESTAERASGWWDLLPFSTHRIELAPGVHTAPDGVVAVDDVRVEVVVDACGGSLEGRRVVDLGCLEGGFTLAFAGLGADAVGIEAREISVRRCELAKALLGDERATFVRGDIKDELVGRDPFDVVFASGILYHVADPAAFLVTMRAACAGFAVIDTHVAHPEVASHGCSDVVRQMSGGVLYRGRMFAEYPSDVLANVKDELLWAAWSDADSFWPLEDDLVAMIRAAGFRSVDKIDVVADGRADRWAVDPTNRVLYVARV
jgi:2-polyprenyl-3-methyl-5-hydroxy-6-metoxy-1,4-benzoquinol methylase